MLELIYHGDHIRCRLAVHGNDDFIVKVPNSRANPTLTGRRRHDGRLEDRGLPGARRRLKTAGRPRGGRRATDGRPT